MLFILAVVLAKVISALDTGVGKLPVMGYDTWNVFGCDYDGALALEQAQLMQEYGLVAAGYKTVRFCMIIFRRAVPADTDKVYPR